MDPFSHEVFHLLVLLTIQCRSFFQSRVVSRIECLVQLVSHLRILPQFAGFVPKGPLQHYSVKSCCILGHHELLQLLPFRSRWSQHWQHYPQRLCEGASSIERKKPWSISARCGESSHGILDVLLRSLYPKELYHFSRGYSFVKVLAYPFHHGLLVPGLFHVLDGFRGLPQLCIQHLLDLVKDVLGHCSCRSAIVVPVRFPLPFRWLPHLGWSYRGWSHCRSHSLDKRLRASLAIVGHGLQQR
mmetsp:Transcript_55172/g.129169  ORF Transcript_55172/g.129169 Transcript_55172/m.129169 type:complete len:243 (+) Transcript_55172:443-1171(+)